MGHLDDINYGNGYSLSIEFNSRHVHQFMTKKEQDLENEKNWQDYLEWSKLPHPDIGYNGAAQVQMFCFAAMGVLILILIGMGIAAHFGLIH